MITAWLSFIAATAGFGMLSLTMQRHARALSDASSGISGWRGKVVLRTCGTTALVASGVVAFRDNPQLGAICWSGYLMAAVLLVTGLHAYAERRAARMILLATAVLAGSVLASWP